MKRLLTGLAAFAVAAVVMSSTAVSQPPGGGPGGGPGGPGGKGGDRRGPGRFEVGKLLPPFAADRLELTDEQKAKIAALEADVKKQIAAILTADQMKKLEAAGPMGGPGGGRPGDGEKGRKGPPDGGRGKKGPDKE